MAAMVITGNVFVVIINELVVLSLLVSTNVHTIPSSVVTPDIGAFKETTVPTVASTGVS
jgi:hypothetical protein